MNAIDRITALRALIAEHDQNYHTLDTPKISDQEYDALVTELKSLEARHPDQAQPDQAAWSLNPSLGKVTHDTPMMSLRTITGADGKSVEDFSDRMAARLNHRPLLNVEPKVDGLAIELSYINGRLARAVTRGNKMVGEDVTAVIMATRVPKVLSTHTPPARLVVRGEACLFKNDFAAINEVLVGRGEKALANVRNAAAGAIRRTYPDDLIVPSISFIAYEWTWSSQEQPQPSGHSQAMAWLSYFGFCTLGQWALTSAHPIQVSDQCQAILAQRDQLAFAIDGAVVKLEDLDLRRQLGHASGEYNWGFAYKFPAMHAVAEILDIILQVGRTGLITPVAITTPTHLDGVVVNRCNLYSRGEIERLGISVGSRVLLQRAGDTIPEVVRVIDSPFPPLQPTFLHCPSCGSPLVREKNQYYCVASQSCPGQAHAFFTRFVSREAANIEDLGSKTIQALMNSGDLVVLSDLYTLGVRRDAIARGYDYHSHVMRYSIPDLYQSCNETLARVLGSHIKAQKLTIAIYRSLTMNLDRFIFSLGIRGVGEESARAVAAYCVSLENFLSMTPENIQSIPGLDITAVGGLMAWLGSTANRSFMHILVHAGLQVAQWKTYGMPLNGVKICLTGSFDVTRKNAEARLREMGATIVSEPTSAHWVFAGDRATPRKVEQARAVGCPVIYGLPPVLEEMIGSCLSYVLPRAA